MTALSTVAVNWTYYALIGQIGNGTNFSGQLLREESASIPYCQDGAACTGLYTAELCGADVPVFMGAEKPLNREHQSAYWFHGCDGLGDHGYPAPSKAPEKMHAAEAIVATIESNPGLVLVTLGPLTNVALALQRNPGIAAKVGRCVVMGGAPCCEGNVTPAAEYNI